MSHRIRKCCLFQKRNMFRQIVPFLKRIMEQNIFLFRYIILLFLRSIAIKNVTKSRSPNGTLASENLRKYTGLPVMIIVHMQPFWPAFSDSFWNACADGKNLYICIQTNSSGNFSGQKNPDIRLLMNGFADKDIPMLARSGVVISNVPKVRSHPPVPRDILL